MGFGVPVGEWLRGPLRDWAEELLDERGICAKQGLLEPGAGPAALGGASGRAARLERQPVGCADVPGLEPAVAGRGGAIGGGGAGSPALCGM